MALDEALGRLAERDPTKAELVKLRYFAGLTAAEAAQVLNISPSTADRYWADAKSWLHRVLRVAATKRPTRPTIKNVREGNRGPFVHDPRGGWADTPIRPPAEGSTIKLLPAPLLDCTGLPRHYHPRHAELGFPGAIAVAAAGWLGSCSWRVMATPVGAGPLVWSDEFNGTAVDPKKWTCNGPGVWGDAVNTPKAASVGGGMLTIKTWTDPATGKNYNAVMGTQDNYLQTYGYFEARVRFHSSPGMWSAFWMMSPTVGHPIGDPTHAGVEVDVVKHRAKDDAGTAITNRYNTALHWDGYSTSEKSTAHLQGPVTGLTNDAWHTYGLLWKPDGYTFYYDDQLMWTKTTPVSARSDTCCSAPKWRTARGRATSRPGDTGRKRPASRTCRWTTSGPSPWRWQPGSSLAALSAGIFHMMRRRARRAANCQR